MINVIKQTIAQVRAQKMLSIISVVGTALSIFLIMVVVMLQQVKVVPFSPESNRDRFLHAKYGSVHVTNGEDWESNGAISYATAKALYAGLKTPEAVTVYTPWNMTVNISQAAQTAIPVKQMQTDDVFWRVFDFVFIDGKPYDKATFDAAIPVVVISESVSRRLFGTTEVTGRQVMIDHTPFSVAGVVKDVSTLASMSYAQIWVPFTVTGLDKSSWQQGIMGSLGATILARSRDDFDDIRAECDAALKKYNKEIEPTQWEIVSRNRPYDQEKQVISDSSNFEPDVKGARRTRFIIYLILLIVPAINLSGMTESRLRKRVEEIGVRRAFGCRRSELFTAILSENLLLTLFAGAIGWLLSVTFAWLCSSFLFAQPYSDASIAPTVDIAMLVQPSTFLWALLFCFILNLLSSGLPAWKASRISLVNAINAK